MFDNDKEMKIVQSLDANKGHGYDDISLTMLTLSRPSVLKLLTVTFQNCLKSDDWKNGSIVRVHTKKNS